MGAVCRECDMPVAEHLAPCETAWQEAARLVRQIAVVLIVLFILGFTAVSLAKTWHPVNGTPPDCLKPHGFFGGWGCG